ncbi:hypothetical protein NHX12_012318 [Muraenolepis orangiensis]|uniref:F-box domain-containing protein n=1 Tax=Muraenolepis orangiensis TaxID=630683 RepID=A0A9Q0I702_9TELE|nr:hypothetical protein NHX12_012318 [Muraenolepis orangiensis]
MSLPPELLQEIFVHLPAHQVVLVGRRVCREWRALADSESLWRERCRREGYQPSDEALVLKDWKMFYFLTKARRNLLKNPRADEGLRHWNIVSNMGDGWRVENVMTTHPNEGTTKNFVTSYGPCSKSQLVDLRKEGYNDYLMDEVKPHITVTDCFHRLNDGFSSIGTFSIHNDNTMTMGNWDDWWRWELERDEVKRASRRI